MLEKILHLDRRWLFLAMAIAIVVPLLNPVRMPFQVSRPVRAVYDEVEQLEPGTRVLMSVDYDPAAQPEVEPFTRAVLRHLLRRDARIVFVTLWDKAPPIVQALIDEIIIGEYVNGHGSFEGDPHPGYTYGEGYCFLGYKEGKQIVIAGMGQNLPQFFPSDSRGTPIGRLPVMAGLNSLRDFRLIINPSAGFPGAKEYVQQVVTRYHLRFAAATTAVSMTDLSPYYPDQMFGLVGGMRGSAEYEQLVGVPGTGTSGLNVLTFGQILVICAIILGNVIFFVGKRRGQR